MCKNSAFVCYLCTSSEDFYKLLAQKITFHMLWKDKRNEELRIEYKNISEQLAVLGEPYYTRALNCQLIERM